MLHLRRASPGGLTQLLDRELRLPGGRRSVARRVASGPGQEVAAAREAAALELAVEGELVAADLARPLDRAAEREVALLALAVLARQRLALAVHLAAGAAPLDLERDRRGFRELEAHLRRLLEFEGGRLDLQRPQERGRLVQGAGRLDGDRDRAAIGAEGEVVAADELDRVRAGEALVRRVDDRRRVPLSHG